VFLTKTNLKKDWLTSLIPALIFQPKLKQKNFLRIDYHAIINEYDRFIKQNNVNNMVYTSANLDLNHLQVGFTNSFYHGSDRYGIEDVQHIPYTNIKNNLKFTLNLNHFDVSFAYNDSITNFQSDLPIGSFKGQSLNYRDNNNTEHAGELDIVLHKWIKTDLIFSTDYGYISYDTGKKSNSDYVDVMTGLKGQLTPKTIIQGKIGYRTQDFQNYENYGGLIFNGSLIENFTSRDTLTFNALSTTKSTIYQDNVYLNYLSGSATYQRLLTKRLFLILTSSIQEDAYPTATTENGVTQKRMDFVYTNGIGIDYYLPRWVVLHLRYGLISRDSNFDQFNYVDNYISMEMDAKF
jgi:hypothetical protein